MDQATSSASAAEKSAPASAHPFDGIGLALSGGGFRAASFSLGVMHYLHSIPSGLKDAQGRETSVLERVRFITSTSGGSITNAFYTLELYAGVPIPEILRKLFANLQGDDMLESALEKLTSNSAWANYPYKTRNLINAFSITYDERLLKRRTFAEYFNKQHNPHVEEVCFNATELNNGISFRFQSDGTEGTLKEFGNNYLKFQPDALEALKSIRVADAVACSSCFPSGFEPVVFPNDFAEGKFKPEDLQNSFSISHNNELDQGKVDCKPFGLMDGGVVDNQGLYSLMLEDDLRRRGVRGHTPQSQFTTMLVADVASYFMDPYEVPEEKENFLTSGKLKWVIRFLMLLIPIPVVGVVLFVAQGAPWYYSFTLISAVMLSLAILGAFWAYGGFIKDNNKNAVGIMLKKFKRPFLNLKLGRIGNMASARVSSVSILVQDLFLKQIRRMYFDQAYENPAIKNRMVSLFIYDLSKAHSKRRLRRLEEKEPDAKWWPAYKDRLIPTDKLETVAEKARNVGTTLWYDPGQQVEMDNVVATGQFTTCYNLIKYLNRMEVNNGSLPADLKSMREQLLADWAKFQQNPLWKVQELKTKS